MEEEVEEEDDGRIPFGFAMGSNSQSLRTTSRMKRFASRTAASRLSADMVLMWGSLI